MQCIACDVMKLCTKVEMLNAIELNYSVFYIDMLCHAVTLTFDLLTLNFYTTSGVMRLNSVQI